MSSVFISRGVIEKALIKPTKRFPEITFSYTPAMVEQRAGLIGDIGKTDDVAKKERLSARLCAELISEWCFEEENYNKICKKGREIAEEKFNEKKIAHEYVSFYKNLVQKNKD